MDATGDTMNKAHSIVTPLERETLVGAITSGYINLLNSVLSQIDTKSIEKLVNLLLSMQKQSGTLYICGNGGSAANAIHLANDFTFGVHPKGDALKVEALPANSSVLTCLGNDIGYENIFSHQLKVKANKSDILLVLSGSGNSENIINAIKQANAIGMATIGIIGFDGGKAKPLLDLPFHFDVDDMQISEDTQVILGHILMKSLYTELKRD